MSRAWLSLGSNIEPERNLAEALRQLRSQFSNVVESHWYRTRAVGFNGADFINLAVAIDTDFDAGALKHWLRALEARQSRDRAQPRFSDRTLDVDIVLFEANDSATGRKSLSSQPEELARAFVLGPLCDLAPDLVPHDGDARTLMQRWKAISVAVRTSIGRVQGNGAGQSCAR